MKIGIWYRAMRLGACLLGAGAGVSAQAADWPGQVRQLIVANFSYPRSAQMRGDEGLAKVRITVEGSGKVAEVAIVQPSGFPILDREAVRIPTKVGAFPPPPGNVKTSIVVPISFKLN